MAYEVVMPYHLHMPSYFLETFTEYPYKKVEGENVYVLSFRSYIYHKESLFPYLAITR